MISKEERAELRRLLADNNESAAEQLIAAAEASPRLLDALDAADERIAELEAIWKLREKEHELAARMVNRRNEELKEAKARIAELEKRDARRLDLIVQREKWTNETEVTLQKRIAELEAAAQWRPMDTAPRDGTWILVLMSPEPSGIHASASVLRFHDAPFADFWRNAHWDRFPELAGYGWLPIPALPEGGV